MSSLSFKRDDAYKALLRFRANPDAIRGFTKLTSSSVTVTNAGKSQVLIGSGHGSELSSLLLNFGGGPIEDIFDGLCALCSSATPMIIKHQVTSRDPDLERAFRESRLGLFIDALTCRLERSVYSLTATISYPS